MAHGNCFYVSNRKATVQYKTKARETSDTLKYYNDFGKKTVHTTDALPNDNRLSGILVFWR